MMWIVEVVKKLIMSFLLLLLLLLLPVFKKNLYKINTDTFYNKNNYVKKKQCKIYILKYLKILNL